MNSHIFGITAGVKISFDAKKSDEPWRWRKRHPVN